MYSITRADTPDGSLFTMTTSKFPVPESSTKAELSNSEKALIEMANLFNQGAQAASPGPFGLDATLAERGQRYGPFHSHAVITQEFKALIAKHTPSETGAFEAFLAPDQQEALDMICHKIGRILNGDPDYADSWHDIAGYAQLVADRLNGKIQ